jgi:hypothetical protein
MTALSLAMKRCGGAMAMVVAVGGSVGGVFRFKSFARSIISFLVITPLCSSNSPMASSSYIEPIHLDPQGDLRGGPGASRASPTNTKASHPEDVRLVVLTSTMTFHSTEAPSFFWVRGWKRGWFGIGVHRWWKIINPTAHNPFVSIPVKTSLGRRLHGCKALRGRHLKLRGIKNGFRLSAGTGCRGANIIFRALERPQITLF